MKRLISVIAMILLASGAAAQDSEATLDIRPAGDTKVEDFLWEARLVVVFANAAADPKYREQIELLEEGADALIDRDVIVFTDTDPSARSPLRRELRPRGFMFAVIAKNGDILLRKPLPWSVREITASIDKTPVRQQEIRDRRSAPHLTQ